MITMKLDIETTKVDRNWTHFARKLNVGEKVIESLKCYGTFSPTANAFDTLESTKPELTIGTLKQVFTDIERDDLKELLNKDFKPEDDGKKVTTVFDKFPLEDIALGLDRFGGPVANWKGFAMHEMIGIAENEGELHQFESPLSENPTAQLFQLLRMKMPHLTLGELYNVLSSDEVKRHSTAKRLIDPNVVESSWRSRLVTKVIVPGSELLRKISSDLNREVPGEGDWKTVASQLGIPYDYYIQLENRKEKRSPTKEVLEMVVTQRPRITISEIVQQLKNIDRHDVSKVIEEELDVEDFTGAMRDLTVAMPD